MPSSSPPASPARPLGARLARLGPLGTLILAGLGLQQYGAGFGSHGAEHVPMALSTALGFLLLAIAALLLLYRGARPGAEFSCRCIEYSGGLVAGYGGLVLLAWLTHWPINPDAGWIESPGTIEGYPVGYMSPVTGMLFMMAGLSLFAGARCRFPESHTDGWLAVSGFLGTAVGFFGLLFSVAYALDAPLLYGGKTIPMALSTALGFILLGGSLALHAHSEVSRAAAGSGQRRLNLEHEPRLGLLLLFLLFLLFGGLIQIQRTLLWEQTGLLYAHPLQVRLALGQLRAAILNLEENTPAAPGSPAEPEALTDLADIRQQFNLLRDHYPGPPADIEAARMAFEAWHGPLAQHRATRRPAGADDIPNDPAQRQRLAALRAQLNAIDQATAQLTEQQYREAAAVHARQNRQFLIVMAFGAGLLLWITHGIALGFAARQRSERALRAANAYLDNLIDHAGAAILVWDAEGLVTRCNAALASLIGRDAAEIVGQPLARLYSYTTDETALARLAALADGGAGEGVEITWRNHDGVCRTLLFSAVPLFDEDDGQIPIAKVAQGLDITERKQAENQLRQTTERLDAMLMALPDLLFIIDREGAIHDYRSSASDLLYVSPEAFLGKKVREVLPAEAAAIMMAAIEEAALQGRHRGAVYTLPMPTGEAWYELSIARMTGSSPVNPEMVVMARAITQCRVLENQLRKLSLAIEQSAESIVITDLDGQIEYVNEAFLRVTGYTREEALGQNPRVLNSGKTPRATYDALWAALTSGQPWQGEFINQRKDGTEYIEWASISPVRLMDGEIHHYLAVKLDITEHKRTERLLQTRLDLIEFSVTHSLEDLLEATLDKVEDFTDSRIGFIHFVEPDQQHLTLQAWSTRTKAEFCQARAAGEHYAIAEAGVWVDCVAVRQPVIHNDYMALPYRKGLPEGHAEVIRELVTPIIREDKVVAILGVGNKPVDYTENDAEVVTYLADVTWEIAQRKRAEDALREAKEQAETANRAKSQFLAHMSHEIRTPMNAILGFSRLLEQDRLTPEQLDLQHKITESGESLLHIINDILDFSKIEAGQLRIDPQPFTLPPLLERIGHLFRHAADAKGLRLAIEGTPADLGTLTGDALRLEQVLINLIINAIKFTGQGSVALAVSPVTITDAAARLRFTIRDTGIGMSPEALARLFQPFSQGDASITRRFGGTGLGLSISHRLVELMGGQLAADSEVGRGSTFWFELPFQRVAALPAPAPATPAEAISQGPRLTGLRVLAVDDNRINLLLLERVLKREGAVITLAADGQQALQILKAQPRGHDAVLMDIQMPVMDGLTATRAIRADPELTHLPVYALTAGVLAEEREAAWAAGVNDFFAKPLEAQRMIATLARHAGRPGDATSSG